MLALTPALGAGQSPRERLLVSSIEHPSVLAGGRFPRNVVDQLPVTDRGAIDLCALERRLTELAGQRLLVSLMLANNETGVVQPVSEVARLVHQAGGLLHVDAVQGFGRIPCNISDLAADLLTISAHKIGGPKGIGALLRRDVAQTLADPLIRGGGQERGSRAGTENVAGIAGFGAAASAAAAELPAAGPRMGALRNRLESSLKAASPRDRDLRVGSRAPAQYHSVRSARHQGRDRRYCLRSRRRRGVVGGSLFIGQGPALARPRCHGSGAGTGARGTAGQPWSHDHGIRHRPLYGSLDCGVASIT